MTRIKFCGLTREEDIQAVNEIMPEYIGFVFAPKSRRCVSREQAGRLRNMLKDGISAVGVFVDEDINTVAELLNCGIIDIAQLHGKENDDYIRSLRSMTEKPVIKAFRVRGMQDVQSARSSQADIVLLDAGAGDGQVFDWSLVSTVDRPYFLAGGLETDNAASAIEALHPFALDVSSGIETDGRKDKLKMAAFAEVVRNQECGAALRKEEEK